MIASNFVSKDAHVDVLVLVIHLGSSS